MRMEGAYNTRRARRSAQAAAESSPSQGARRITPWEQRPRMAATDIDSSRKGVVGILVDVDVSHVATLARNVHEQPSMAWSTQARLTWARRGRDDDEHRTGSPSGFFVLRTHHSDGLAGQRRERRRCAPGGGALHVSRPRLVGVLLVREQDHERLLDTHGRAAERGIIGLGRAIEPLLL